MERQEISIGNILESATNVVAQPAVEVWNRLNQEGGSVYLLKRMLLQRLLKTRRPYRRLRHA
jgi:hypothetical protein